MDQLWIEKEFASIIRSPREPTLLHQVFTWEAVVLETDEDPAIRANAGPVTVRDHEVADLTDSLFLACQLLRHRISFSFTDFERTIY